MRPRGHSLAISNFLSEVLRDWRGSLELFPANKCRELYWPIPFFGNPVTAVVATVGVNPSSDEFQPCRNWDAVQDSREWKLRLKNYFTGDIPPHEWFIPWRVGLKLLGVSFEEGTAAHFDISYRLTTAMLRNKNTDAREFREMIEHDLEWFFRLLPLCPNLRGLLVFGPVVRSDGTPESLAGFIRKSAPRHGFKVLADGGLVFDQAGQPPRRFFLHEVSSPHRGSVVGRVKESLARDLDHLKRLLQLPKTIPVAPDDAASLKTRLAK